MNKQSDLYIKIVLSSDTKPSGAFPGEYIIEKDTGDVYEWTGATWQQITDAGAIRVLIDNIDLGVDIEVGHGKTLVNPLTTGSHNTTTTKSIVVAAGVGIKNKVLGIVFSTLVDTACIVQLTDGSGGTVIYEIELQSSIVPGVVISPNIVEICETAANTALHLKLGTAQKVSYSIIVDQSA